MKDRVLITDGDQRAALACVRALGRSGYRCFVLGPEQGCIAGASRFCEARAVSPDLSEDAGTFIKHVNEQAHAFEADFLLPITEKSLRLLLPVRDQLGKAIVPFPSLEVFSKVSDKGTVLQVAQDLGIPVPQQCVWSSPLEAAVRSIPEERFPVAIKPTRSVSPSGSLSDRRHVVYAPDLQSLEHWIASSDPGIYPVLVQERVAGPGVGVFVLFWEGALQAVVGHRRLREKPPSGGVSVVRESTVPDTDVMEHSLRLLGALGWSHGVAMVEFKREARTGTPYLMEVNGRFWGSLQLAIDAGVDFPTLLLACAKGSPPGEAIWGSPGVKTRWLLGDLDQLAARLLKGRERLNLPPCSPGGGRAILEFLADFRPGVRLEVLRPSDPGPFLCEIASWLRHLSSRRSSA